MSVNYFYLALAIAGGQILYWVFNVIAQTLIRIYVWKRTTSQDTVYKAELQKLIDLYNKELVQRTDLPPTSVN